MQDERYLQLLSRKFPNAQSVVTELINLRAILSLPKGTEHFVSDLHGEANAFIHMIKNASGVIRKKVDEAFGDLLPEEEKRALCALIYYPDERIDWVKRKYNGEEIHSLNEGFEYTTIQDWYKRRLHQVVAIARAVTIKYSRSKVYKLLPKDYAYVIKELLHESSLEQKDRQAYYNAIIEAIIETGCAEQLLISITYFIHSMAN